MKLQTQPSDFPDSKTKIPVMKLGDSGEVFYELALEMINTIEANNAKEKPTVIICPVGPTGQYPIFVRLVQQRRLSLKSCFFLNMDEYLDDQGSWIDIKNPLSFRGFMEREVYNRIPEELLMPKEQRVFPDPKDLGHIPAIIKKMGTVDICIGGIGLNGHLAFNEPEPEMDIPAFSALSARTAHLAAETRAIHAAENLGGSLNSTPSLCVTIGMKEILSAARIRLGCFRSWHRGTVRQAVYGEVSSSFPVTLLQNHPDTIIYITAMAGEQSFE